MSILKSETKLKELNLVAIVQNFMKKIASMDPEHPLLFPKFKSTRRGTEIDPEIDPFSYSCCYQTYKNV